MSSEFMERLGGGEDMNRIAEDLARHMRDEHELGDGTPESLDPVTMELDRCCIMELCYAASRASAGEPHPPLRTVGDTVELREPVETAVITRLSLGYVWYRHPGATGHGGNGHPRDRFEARVGGDR